MPDHIAVQSLYVHVPFCPKRCLFCGCTTEIGQPGSLVLQYFAALEKEMERTLPLLDATRPVTQVHFGGGTPNGVPFKFLREIEEVEAALATGDLHAAALIQRAHISMSFTRLKTGRRPGRG